MPSDDEAKAFMSTDRSESVPVVDEDSWSRYWSVPVCTAEAVTPRPAALMLATMSASDPLPVETLVAVADPAVNRELFTWPWAEAAAMVARDLAPAVPLRVTVPPGVTVLSTLDVPSTLTDAVHPHRRAGHGRQPQRGERSAAGDLQALARALVDGGERSGRRWRRTRPAAPRRRPPPRWRSAPR